MYEKTDLRDLLEMPTDQLISSPILFVRSQDHLSEYKPGVKGLVMTAYDVISIFGKEAVEEILDKGSAIIVKNELDPGVSLMARRESLYYSREDVASRAQIREVDVKDAESKDTRTPMWILVKICEVLNLDPKRMSLL